MPLQLSSMPEGLQAILDDLVTEAVRSLGEHEVLGKSDLDALLGARGAGSVACDDIACAAEIGGALGVQLLVAGRVAKLGDSIVIVLKLIDAQNRRVVNSAKLKAANIQDEYDRAVGEAVQILFGRRPADTGPMTSAANDPMRARISERDWARYQYQVSLTGRDITLSNWVVEQNGESTALLAGEIIAGTIFALSVPLVVGSHQSHPDDRKPAVVLAISTVALGTLLGIDFLNIGGVDVVER